MSDCYDPMDCSPPGSSVPGVSQARILEWIPISFSKGSSWSRYQMWVSCIADILLSCRWILHQLSLQGRYQTLLCNPSLAHLWLWDGLTTTPQLSWKKYLVLLLVANYEHQPLLIYPVNAARGISAPQKPLSPSAGIGLCLQIGSFLLHRKKIPWKVPSQSEKPMPALFRPRTHPGESSTVTSVPF